LIQEFQIEIAKKIIDTGLVDAVFHSVGLYENESGQMFPVYAMGAEQIYIGPDDTKGRFAYIRQTGPAKSIETIKDGSCSKTYKMAYPLRIVIFKDNEDLSFYWLQKKLLSFAFMPNINLQSITNDAFKLGKQESPIGSFNFDATTFYIAIDVIATIIINEEVCEEENCIVHPNPICS
jgi:hypothetical protein